MRDAAGRPPNEICRYRPVKVASKASVARRAHERVSLKAGQRAPMAGGAGMRDCRHIISAKLPRYWLEWPTLRFSARITLFASGFY